MSVTLDAENDGVRVRHVSIGESRDGIFGMLSHSQGLSLKIVDSEFNLDLFLGFLDMKLGLTLMMPGKSTRTIRCRPGPLTDNDMTSLLIVWLFLTEFFILSSISFRKAAS